MKSVTEIPLFHNIPVIVRAAMNEPVENGVVQGSFRLSRAVATLKFLSDQGARVIVISHIGEAGTETLEPVAKKLATLVNKVSFCKETIGPVAREAIRAMHPGDILVLENLRRNKGEVANDPAFAKELASLGDVFVEDSFDTCHREHASIVGLPKLLPSYAGLTLIEEVEHLTKARAPQSPSLAIIGGAKFSTKQPVLAALLNSYDKVFVGGALAIDFFKAQGHPVGASLVSGGNPAPIKELLKNPKLVLPIDSLVAAKDTPMRESARVAQLGDVKADEAILDDGPGSSSLLLDLVAKAKSVVWNGTLGNYENGFVDASDALALGIAKSGAYSVVGGGDTITCISVLNVLDKYSFVSTGGGAMLDFLAKGTLPGIEALG